MRGEAFGLVNFLSRPFAAFSTIVVEYTSSPLSFVLVLSVITTQAVGHLNEINEKTESKIIARREADLESEENKTDDFVKI